MTSVSSQPKPHSTEHDPRWQAVLARDVAAADCFVYAVTTTGVYCHPGSPTRLPKPAHVVFFDTPADAEAAGYRPSQRTVASRDHVARVAQACRRMDRGEAASLTALAAAAGMSPYHFHRVFKAATGVTPKAYAAAARAKALRATMADSATVTAALYDAGFGSSSRLYEAADAVLGMIPGDYRAGGANTQIRFAIAVSSLGALLVACSARGVCEIALGDDADALARALQDQFPHATLIGDDPAFDALVARVVGCVESPGQALDLPLDVRGTVFQQQVWAALRQIPPGTTTTYAEIAQRIGRPTAARAVALACAANRLAVAIPCHRVVRSDGALSGYRWGVERKHTLLARERQHHLSPEGVSHDC